LHLLSKHLDEAGITYLRIDGGCPPPQRQAKLDQFAKDDEKRVLIMTTGTGGFGYVSRLGCFLGTRAFVVLTSSQAEPDLREPRLHHRAAVEPRGREPGHRTRHPVGAGKRGVRDALRGQGHRRRGLFYRDPRNLMVRADRVKEMRSQQQWKMQLAALGFEETPDGIDDEENDS